MTAPGDPTRFVAVLAVAAVLITAGLVALTWVAR